MIKKKVTVQGKKCNFELWIPSIEEELKGGIKMQEFNKVKAFRVGAGLTQDQMADALGVSRRTYQAKEDGSSEWKTSEMAKFVEVVNAATGSNYSVKDIFF